MKVRFAVAPDSGSLESTKVIAFADALEASGFDGVWLSDLPVAPVVDPLLGVAWPRTACAPSRPSELAVEFSAARSFGPSSLARRGHRDAAVDSPALLEQR
jgi:hypothetical protein